ncbi:hypothetical protein [Leuconostoc pseudomesenteroides]|uniref:hypothetical protein n=1 Tax=Leuconostoc pseudomesenteroides TaxID=33968 RepID=UPI001E60AD15|nr:hypothetical protein [Leuconostoc pseudomesenteroides]
MTYEQASSSVATTTVGKWTLSAYNNLALGSTSYNTIRQTYGDPTYLTADSQYAYATWQSQSGAKVVIIFTPSGSENNVQLIASSKSQTGLQ